MSDPKVLPTREGYDRWATTYDDDASSNWLIALDQLEVERTLGNLAGRDVLDVGGGTGRHAIRLSRSGARVTVLDFSEEMIAKARGKPGAEEIRLCCRPSYSGTSQLAIWIRSSASSAG